MLRFLHLELANRCPYFMLIYPLENDMLFRKPVIKLDANFRWAGPWSRGHSSLILTGPPTCSPGWSYAFCTRHQHGCVTGFKQNITGESEVFRPPHYYGMSQFGLTSRILPVSVVSQLTQMFGSFLETETCITCIYTNPRTWHPPGILGWCDY